MADNSRQESFEDLPNHGTSLLADSSSSISSAEGEEPQSIDTLLQDYPELFSRKYHKFKQGSYAFPIDAQELERQFIQFDLIYRARRDNLFLAPVEAPRTILDVGTGTGIWATSLARNAFPDARIIGMDLSDHQPGDPPENVEFVQQDCSERDWDFPQGSFDFIYGQSLFGSLQDFAQYLMIARKYLTRGSGWIECCEMDPVIRSDDNTIPHDWAIARWTKYMMYATERTGRPFRIAHNIKQWMVEAGYVDVHEVIAKIPLGGWPKDPRLKKLGKSWQILVDETLAAASYMLFHQVLDWTREDIEIFLLEVRQSLYMRKVHGYYNLHTVYGRKPSAEEERKMGRMAPPPKPDKSKDKSR